MFTGIIEATAKILEKTPSGVTVERPRMFDDLKLGSSISVAGVCLSVVALTKTAMRFDVVAETLKKSTLGKLQTGDRVNLERAMQLTDRFEGHVVQGHVEGTATVVAPSGGTLTVSLPQSLMPAVLPKGSIAIDGVSLTIASIQDAHVTVALIPHTLKNTTLGSLEKGDQVNVETDVMVRTLQSLSPHVPHAH